MADKITKTFRRVVRTGDYESVEVVSTIEREVETGVPGATSYEEQVDKLRSDATNQLVEDLDMILDKLGVEEKRVKVESNRARPAGV